MCIIRSSENAQGGKRHNNTCLRVDKSKPIASSFDKHCRMPNGIRCLNIEIFQHVQSAKRQYQRLQRLMFWFHELVKCKLFLHRYMYIFVIVRARSEVILIIK